MFMEQRKESLAAIFKGLGQDPYPVVRLVLEKLWGGLWSDTKLKKTLKIGLFNETTLSHVRSNPHFTQRTRNNAPAAT